MAPFNEQEQRIAMRNNSSINVYWSLSSKMKKSYIKFGSDKCYLKEIDILTDWFDVNELDPTTLCDEQDEIIFNLRDKLCSLQEEINNLKLKCINLGICI